MHFLGELVVSFSSIIFSVPAKRVMISQLILSFACCMEVGRPSDELKQPSNCLSESAVAAAAPAADDAVAAAAAALA